VAARLLRDEGREADVLAIAPLDELQGDARANLERLPGEAPRPFEAEALMGSGAVVDALLGTGFEGEPREPVAGAIAAINAQDAPVVACDVPSGVNASTGEVEGEAVRAEVTASFHGSKLGLHVMAGAEHAGGGEGPLGEPQRTGATRGDRERVRPPRADRQRTSSGRADSNQERCRPRSRSATASRSYGASSKPHVTTYLRKSSSR